VIVITNPYQAPKILIYIYIYIFIYIPSSSSSFYAFISLFTANLLHCCIFIDSIKIAFSKFRPQYVNNIDYCQQAAKFVTVFYAFGAK